MAISVAVIVGTRPEIIKMGPVFRCLAKHPAFEATLVSTGQHREMSHQTFSALDLKPDEDLDLMQADGTLESFASRALDAMGLYLRSKNPSIVLVHGDTTTTLMSSLAAFYARIPVGHVEAGMRTGDINSPWPEEMNRRLVAQIAKWHFCPIERNRQSLLQEGIAPEDCYVTGNTVVDALLWMRDKLRDQPLDVNKLQQRIVMETSDFKRILDDRAQRLILVTGHRRESQGQGTRQLCLAIRRLVEQFPDVVILFPVHPNPKVKQVVNECLAGQDRIYLTDPMDYADFVWFMDRCHLIISDSGGIQGEAMSLGKPVLVTRDITEYPEAVDRGGCLLVGTQFQSIYEGAARLLSDSTEYSLRSNVVNPYGDGKSSERILKILLRENGADR